MKRLLLLFAAFGLLVQAEAKIPKNFRTENLVAWCIVPFDANKRNPAERSQMLVDLGLSKCAYDWRSEHVPTFEDEILQYKKHGIEYFAFWSQHDQAFELFEKHGIRPQIWITLKSPPKDSHFTQAEKVAYAVKELLPLARKTHAMGARLGLYNHGGWGGEPENLIAVAKALRAELGSKSVGIVYNFHHAHERIADFEAAFLQMKPYLLCLNLNGMTDPQRVAADPDKNKILPIGSGKHEKAMIQTVLKSGYKGPVGILGHIAHQDAKISLQNNIDGLQALLSELGL